MIKGFAIYDLIKYSKEGKEVLPRTSVVVPLLVVVVAVLVVVLEVVVEVVSFVAVTNIKKFARKTDYSEFNR